MTRLASLSLTLVLVLYLLSTWVLALLGHLAPLALAVQLAKYLLWVVLASAALLAVGVLIREIIRELRR